MGALMRDDTMNMWDFAALRYFGRQKAANASSGLSLSGIPISMKTATLLFARPDLLVALVA
jgi:hypothetical protein